MLWRSRRFGECDVGGDVGRGDKGLRNHTDARRLVPVTSRTSSREASTVLVAGRKAQRSGDRLTCPNPWHDECGRLPGRQLECEGVGTAVIVVAELHVAELTRRRDQRPHATGTPVAIAGTVLAPRDRSRAAAHAPCECHPERAQRPHQDAT